MTPALLPSADREFHDAMLDWTARGSRPLLLEELQLPVRAVRASSPFGIRHDPFQRGVRAHWGIDLPQRAGEAVRAAASGVVAFAGWARGYGLLVRVDHGDGGETRYAHLSAINVGAGDVLRQGDELGRVGSTGRSTGAHLHFEVRDYGRPVDPLMRLGEPIMSSAALMPPESSAMPTPPKFAEAGNLLPSPILN